MSQYASWDELRKIWDQRDARYRRRRNPLTAEEIAMIRADRLRETELVPPHDRIEARRAYNRWNPPYAVVLEENVGRYWRKPLPGV